MKKTHSIDVLALTLALPAALWAGSPENLLGGGFHPLAAVSGRVTKTTEGRLSFDTVKTGQFSTAALVRDLPGLSLPPTGDRQMREVSFSLSDLDEEGCAELAVFHRPKVTRYDAARNDAFSNDFGMSGACAAVMLRFTRPRGGLVNVTLSAKNGVTSAKPGKDYGETAFLGVMDPADFPLTVSLSFNADHYRLRLDRPVAPSRGYTSGTWSLSGPFWQGLLSCNLRLIGSQKRMTATIPEVK